MKKFLFEDTATNAAQRIYGSNDWTVVENPDATFSVVPPTRTVCPPHMFPRVGQTGKIENLFGLRNFIITSEGGTFYHETTL
jgi:hypothetical protein